jgi:hypothetical protein
VAVEHTHLLLAVLEELAGEEMEALTKAIMRLPELLTEVAVAAAVVVQGRLEGRAKVVVRELLFLSTSPLHRQFLLLEAQEIGFAQQE